tara:strand:- start:1205 stop:2242 length:1038 start_codon:yes stop_codon:yes gene_type:complete
MAETFKNRVDALTGFAGLEDDALSDWLTAGARSILNILPISKLERIASTSVFTNTIDIQGKRIVAVTRKDAGNASRHMPCRKIPVSMKDRASDPLYMEYAQASDPVYCIQTDNLETKPDSVASNDSAVTFINTGITVAHGDGASGIDNFPDEAEDAVVLYAARNALQRLMNDIHTDDIIDHAVTGILVDIKAEVDDAHDIMDKFEVADQESVFGDEETYLTANSQLTLVKDAMDQAKNVINNDQPNENTDAFGAQAAEDTELVASALAIVGTELQRAQTHLAEWNAIGDMRIKEVQGHLSVAGGYIQELTARLNRQQAKYTWYTQQYQMVDAQYKEQIQTLQGPK